MKYPCFGCDIREQVYATGLCEVCHKVAVDESLRTSTPEIIKIANVVAKSTDVSDLSGDRLRELIKLANAENLITTTNIVARLQVGLQEAVDEIVRLQKVRLAILDICIGNIHHP